MAPAALKSYSEVYKATEAEIDTLKAYFNPKNIQKPKEYPANSAKVHSVDWSADGKRLASGSYDRTATSFLFNEETGRISKDCTFRGHTGAVDQLSWHPTNPDILTTVSDDRSVRVWDAKKSREIANIQTKGDNINLCWTPDTHTIAVGNKEDLITFIDTRTWKISNEEQFKFEVNEMSWNKEGDLFYLTSGQGSIHILSYPDLKQQHVIEAHPANCICIKFNPNGLNFAIGGADALVSIWDVNELVCIRTLSRLDWPIRTISYSYDGKMIASGSEDHFIDISHVDTGTKICEVPGDSPTYTVAWHPSKYLLAFACEDKERHSDREGTIKLFGVKVD